VKGGGHNFNTGFANIDAGITIDLRGINKVDLSTSGTAKVGGGATWDEVFTPLDAKSLMVTAGRVAGVGVGGVTTGGELQTLLCPYHC
jgi:FAD/FMN-containing dehydrogenase